VNARSELILRLSIAALALGLMSLPGTSGESYRLTDGQRTRISAGVAALGCAGGRIEVDDDADERFEVENVRCSDGFAYDLTFDSDFNLRKKERED
jgi:hypothetical protein